jgi:ribonuclease HI
MFYELAQIRGKGDEVMITAWFDGVCEPINPGGHAAYGALVKVDDVVVWSEGKYVGFGDKISNNVAEYSGIIAVFREIEKHSGPALICGDSKLVIEHLNGNWRVNGGLYFPFYLEAKKLFDELRNRVTLQWVPRGENSECDVLSKQVLKDRGVKFRIQREG